MLAILSIENWAILYKLAVLFTIMFHTDRRIRSFCLWFLYSWVVTGFIKEYYLHGKYWFMMQAVHELITLLLVGRLLGELKFTKFVISMQAIGLLLLNIYQFQTVTEGFMSPPDYIWWNMIGFEVILFAMWFNTGILKAIRERKETYTVMATVFLGFLIFIAGNY